MKPRNISFYIVHLKLLIKKECNYIYSKYRRHTVFEGDYRDNFIFLAGKTWHKMWRARRGKNTGQAEREPNQGQGGWAGGELGKNLRRHTWSWAWQRRESGRNDDDDDNVNDWLVRGKKKTLNVPVMHLSVFIKTAGSVNQWSCEAKNTGKSYVQPKDQVVGGRVIGKLPDSVDECLNERGLLLLTQPLFSSGWFPHWL